MLLFRQRCNSATILRPLAKRSVGPQRAPVPKDLQGIAAIAHDLCSSSLLLQRGHHFHHFQPFGLEVRRKRPLPKLRNESATATGTQVVPLRDPLRPRAPSLTSEHPSAATLQGSTASAHRRRRASLGEELSTAQQRAPLPQTVQGSTASAHTRFVVAPAAAVLLAFNLRRQAAPRAAIAEESRRKGHQHAPPQMCFAAAVAPWVDGRHKSPGNLPKQQQRAPRASQESKASPSRIARLFCLRSAGQTHSTWRGGGGGEVAGAGDSLRTGPAQAARIPGALRTLWPSG